jgi:hypothetical protein
MKKVSFKYVYTAPEVLQNSIEATTTFSSLAEATTKTVAVALPYDEPSIHQTYGDLFVVQQYVKPLKPITFFNKSKFDTNRKFNVFLCPEIYI